jgi:hypothetical protein
LAGPKKKIRLLESDFRLKLTELCKIFHYKSKVDELMLKQNRLSKFHFLPSQFAKCSRARRTKSSQFALLKKFQIIAEHAVS